MTDPWISKQELADALESWDQKPATPPHIDGGKPHLIDYLRDRFDLEEVTDG